MAQHRTRKEKEKIKIARVQQVDKPETQPQTGFAYSYTSETSSSNQPKTVNTLLKVDQKYIVKDLVRTMLISGLLLVIVIGIYFYLRYN